MRKPFLLLLCFIAVCIFSCSTESTETQTDPMDRLPENQAGEVVQKAIDFAGGWESWATKNTLSFYKIIESIDSAGQIKRRLRQFHQYQIQPQFKARMTWEENGDEFMVINNGTEARKYKNGVEMIDDNSKNQAWNSSFGSNYVISMPFKLTDPGVTLTYDGIDTISNQQAVHAVKVEYAKGAGSAGGMHIWWYYFDDKSYDLVANYLDYGNGYSLTTYDKFQNVDGIRIHDKRSSYSSNEAKELVALKTIYRNESMKFDAALDQSLFVLK